MNIAILAARKDKALDRIAKIAPVLGERFGVPVETLYRLTAENKDREVEAMERLEAVADLVEFLAQETEEKVEPAKPEKPIKPKTERK